jgi:hypothetical protein
MNTPLHLAIIGGGAAGMISAITAARAGARVTIFERQDRVGKKLLATGNGQCNLTNINCSTDHYYGADPGFVKDAFSRLSVQQTIQFFDSLGVCTASEEGGKVYPLTRQASTVLDVLRYELARLGVQTRMQAEVREITNSRDGFTIQMNKGSDRADRIIIACGGKAAPQLSGSESGVMLLEKLGHSAAPIFPALVPLKTSMRFNKHLKGVKINARLTAEISGQIPLIEEGELLFTEYGLSGPPIIQLSQPINRARLQNQKVDLRADLFPAWGADRLTDHLKKRFAARPDAPLDVAMIGLIHKRLISPVIQLSGITDAHKPAGTVSGAEISMLIGVLKNWMFDITGSLSWTDAQLMAGGILTRDFNPATMESHLAKGLYAVGEVLDISGDCGGYNLQWAWSSGFVAGSAIAKQ